MRPRASGVPVALQGIAASQGKNQQHQRWASTGEQCTLAELFAVLYYCSTRRTERCLCATGHWQGTRGASTRQCLVQQRREGQGVSVSHQDTAQQCSAQPWRAIWDQESKLQESEITGPPCTLPRHAFVIRLVATPCTPVQKQREHTIQQVVRRSLVQQPHGLPLHLPRGTAGKHAHAPMHALKEP